jgi:hypothetical protein
VLIKEILKLNQKIDQKTRENEMLHEELQRGYDSPKLWSEKLNRISSQLELEGKNDIDDVRYEPWLRSKECNILCLYTITLIPAVSA